MADKKSSFSKFRDGFREGYDEQDKKIKADPRPTSDRIKDGLKKGASDEMAQLFNPFSWLKSLWK